MVTTVKCAIMEVAAIFPPITSGDPCFRKRKPVKIM